MARTPLGIQMDCLNPNEKSIEPTLLGGSHAINSKPRRSWHLVATSLLGLLSVILLALIIWLAVEVQHNRDAIHALQRSFTTAAQSGEVISSAGMDTGGSTSLNTVAATYPAAYLSTNATASAGYAFSGSLYRGSGYWAAQPPMANPRADFDTVCINDTLYAFGGHDGEDNYLSTAFSYDTFLNITQDLVNMTSPRSHYAASSVDGQTILVVGGYSSKTNESSNEPEACTLVFNTTSNMWTAGACLVVARGSTCGAVVNGKMFVAGGLGANGSALNSIEVFDPSKNTWSTFASLPTARSQAGCAALGNSLLVAGGTNGSNGVDLSEVWAVDSARGNMTRLADMLYPRFDLQLVSLPNNTGVVAVGGGQHVNNTEVGLHYVEQYSPASNQWVEKAMMDNQRFAFGAAYATAGVFALGGHVFCNVTSGDCGSSVRDSVEKLYDSDHPDVYLHLQQAGGNFEDIAPPNTSQVLLLASSVAVNGYNNAGSMYQGSGYWGSGPDLPQALSDLNAVGYGNVAYIVGGLDLNATEAVDTIYKYDAVLDTFTAMSPMPEPRTRGGADILGSQLYYVGGFTSGDDSAEPVDDMLIYDIPTDTWTRSTARLSSARSDLCMAAVNGTLYAAGGYSTNYTEILNLAEKFDPNTNAWIPITSMPTPRGDVMCAALNGQFVAAGGYYDPTLQFLPASFRTEVQAYNPATDEWRSLADLPDARGDASMTAVPSQFGDRLLFLGGETQDDNLRTGVATNQVQEYSSALDMWILKAPMANARFRADVTYAEGHVIIFGGASSSLCADDGSGLEVCTLRPVAGVEEYFDTDNPDVFVYTAN